MKKAIATRKPAAPAVASPPPSQPVRLPLIALGLGLLMVARLTPWMGGDLWFDEVLTFDDYVLQDSLAEVVGTYPAANHHVLYSVILWLWVRLLDPLLFEWIMRLPSALFSAAMVALATWHWSQWLGRRVAVVCGVTLLASLVVGSFAYQMRGYSLAMLLGAVATSGAMELVAGSRRRGLMLALPAAALLPVVLPTNVLLLAALGVFLLLNKPRALAWTKWVLDVLLPIVVATAVGCAYYLTVLDELPRVLKNAEGWPHPFPVVRAWGMGFLAHFGVVILLFLWSQRALLTSAPASDGEPIATEVATSAEASTDANPRADVLLAWKLIAPILLLAGVFLLVMRPSPFPRTFLVCLPTVTFAVFYACRTSPVWSRLHSLVPIAVIALNSVVWQLVTDHLTRAALQRGEHPQNLVMQYYRGRHDLTQMTIALKQNDLGDRFALLTDFHDFSATRFYWRGAQLPADRVMSAWWNPPTDWQARFGPDVRLAVQAPTEELARDLIREAKALPGDPPRLTPLLEVDGQVLWTPAGP